MREKYNRLTWKHRESKNGKHPKLIKEMVREMFDTVDEECMVMLRDEALEAILEDTPITNNPQKEAEIITNAIDFLANGNYQERKPYVKNVYGDGVEINGYRFYINGLCWYVEKPTDIGIDPQYKGEPLVKVIPTTVPVSNISVVLNAQPWMYI